MACHTRPPNPITKVIELGAQRNVATFHTPWIWAKFPAGEVRAHPERTWFFGTEFCKNSFRPGVVVVATLHPIPLLNSSGFRQLSLPCHPGSQVRLRYLLFILLYNHLPYLMNHCLLFYRENDVYLAISASILVGVVCEILVAAVAVVGGSVVGSCCFIFSFCPCNRRRIFTCWLLLISSSSVVVIVVVSCCCYR